MDGATLFGRMRARYAAMSSYVDHGSVVDARVKPHVVKLTFRTFFRRPMDLRFEWEAGHPYPPMAHWRRYGVLRYRDTRGYRFSSYKNAVEPVEDLRLGLAGATGVSLGSSNTILSMLLPRDGEEDDDSFLDRLVFEPEVGRAGAVHECLRARNHAGTVYEFVVDGDLTLLEVRQRSENGEVLHEMHQDVLIDRRLNGDLFPE